MMTMGKHGSMFYTAPDEFQQVPAFATQVIDRVGAGDAVLCVTALCAVMNAPAEVIAFLGNVVGAEAVTIMGNQRSIERIPLYRHVECLLKVHRSADAAAPNVHQYKRWRSDESRRGRNISRPACLHRRADAPPLDIFS